MYIKIGNEFADADLIFLEEILIMLDSKLFEMNCNIQEAINNSMDPDSLGLFDKAEYIVGIGFAACQRYMSSTFGPIEIEKSTALKIGPTHESGEAIAKVIYESANYWKHSDEWKPAIFTMEPDSGIAKVNHFDADILSKQQKRTIGVIENVTPWAEYTCANVLASLTKTSEINLSKLIPILTAWRNQLDKSRSGHGSF